MMPSLSPPRSAALPHPNPWLLRTLLPWLLLLCHALALAEPTRALLWEIKSGQNKGYLLGSIHVAKADFYPLPESVNRAFEQAGVLAVEVDTTDPQLGQKMAPLITWGEGDQLEKHLSSETWGQLKSMLGDNVAQFQPLKPAMAASALMINAFAQAGYSPADGIDLHFMQRAKAMQKPLVELESIEFQARLLGSISDADGDAMLRQTIESMKNGEARAEIEQMVASWRAGDASALGKLLQESADKDPGSKKLHALLFDQRNGGMAQKIAKLVQNGKKPFVVVGAGHMAGNNNILIILKNQGFQIRQVL
jgi:uncharacterized protein YbaP (TraB family)